jgi:DNA-directed RNA polymerase specialized sigma24 family protein
MDLHDRQQPRINRLRREQARSASLLFDSRDERGSPSSAEEIAISAARAKQLRSPFGVLTKDRATIFRLSFLEEKPHAEIAGELRIPLRTVKFRARLALSRLRALLDSYK